MVFGFVLSLVVYGFPPVSISSSCYGLERYTAGSTGKGCCVFVCMHAVLLPLFSRPYLLGGRLRCASYVLNVGTPLWVDSNHTKKRKIHSLPKTKCPLF